ncbi:MAG: hypothetical protein ACFUZC_23815 [Chthoniobacteraceae bacterium]
MRHSVSLGAVICILLTAQAVWAQQTVEEWQKKTVAEFPEIGVSGSPMNLKFVQTVNALRVSNPAFFKTSNWPYLVAQQIAGAKPPESAIIPGLTEEKKAEPAADNADGAMDVRKLAADFKASQSAASAKYTGKRLTVSGEIQRITQPENSVSAAFVYLKTGDGLPSVKIELNKMKKYATEVVDDIISHGKNGYEFRVNDTTLEVRSHETSSRYVGPYGHRADSVKNGTWVPIISKGEAIKIMGTCSGMTYGITLTGAELQRNEKELP